jgi:drug/metabolite transporter (DMT)-like permease
MKEPGQGSGQSANFAAGMLVFACLLWACFFTLTKNWQNAAGECPGGGLVSSLTIVGVRTVLALAILAVLRPRSFIPPSRRDLRVGCWLGFLHCGGNVLQVWGLASTSPALSGFFTSLASLWVPPLALLLFRLPVTGSTWLALLLGVMGLAVLGIDPAESWGLSFGDGLTLLASFFFAMHINYLGRLGRTVSTPHLTIMIIGITGLPAFIMVPTATVVDGQFLAWANWLWNLLCEPAVLRDILALTLLSTLLATHLMNTYQPRVSASRAAIIYLLEPVMAAALSVAVGHDRLTGRLVLGGAIILLANTVVELPLWLRERAKRRSQSETPIARWDDKMQA